MTEYRHSGHAVYDLKYHMIWCTKYRYKLLRGRGAERARDLIRQICQAREVVIVRGAVSPDHVHLLLAAPPILAPAKLAQYIKGRSSRHLQAEFPELRKRYWGQHMWARGYFCATVGAVDEATIKAYIEYPECSIAGIPLGLEKDLGRGRHYLNLYQHQVKGKRE